MRTVVGHQGFIEAVHMMQVRSPVIEGDGIGRKSQGQIDPRQRLFVTALRSKDDADRGANLGAIRIEDVGASIIDQRLFQPSKVDQGATAHEKRRNVVWLEFIAPVETGVSVLKTSGLVQGKSGFADGVPIAGIELEHPLITENGFVQPPQINQDVAQICP